MSPFLFFLLLLFFYLCLPSSVLLTVYFVSLLKESAIDLVFPFYYMYILWFLHSALYFVLLGEFLNFCDQWLAH